VANHLSRLENDEITSMELEIQEEFPDKKFFVLKEKPGFGDITNYKVVEAIPNKFTWHHRQKLIMVAN